MIRFEDAQLSKWWAAAFPDTDVIDEGLDDGHNYDAYVIVDERAKGRVSTLIGFNPHLTPCEQEQAALECKRRVDSFADRGRNGPYAWLTRVRASGYKTWIRHRSPVAQTIWSRTPSPRGQRTA
jgi:hypothetical protein